MDVAESSRVNACGCHWVPLMHALETALIQDMQMGVSLYILMNIEMMWIFLDCRPLAARDCSGAGTGTGRCGGAGQR